MMGRNLGELSGRRGSTAIGIASAVSGVTIIAGAAVLTTRGDAHPQPVTSSSASARDTRLVGFAHIAVAVPQSWRTNATRCGTPQADTVVIDVGATPACLTGRPVGVDSVEVTPGRRRFDFRLDDTLTIDGMAAERQATTCRQDAFSRRVCNGTVYVPSTKVSFRAESSTSAAEVDRILRGIRVSPRSLGVPGYQELFERYQSSSAKEYGSVLEKQGFTVESRTREVAHLDPGFVVGASPQPGSMLRPGATVTITRSG